MSDALFSPSWYRVADLKPRIRAHTVIHRHAYRGKVWFILQDQAAGRSHRFTPAAHHFIGLMDGNRTVQEIWDAAGKQLGDAAPTQEDVIRLLGQLHAADALLCDVPPDSQEVFRRHQKHTRAEWRRRLWTPLALRFPLWDPDRFLDRTLPYVGWLFGWIGALLWLAVVGTGAVLTATHWTDLTKDVIDRLLAPQNLLLLWLVYPAVKALHELGHAYATKKFGGEVHEIGVMLLVLTPVPYVDATAAWGFRDKGQRMLVGAAGIAVELFLGSLALFVWLTTEPGAVRAIAYNVMLISGISTLLFNGNPLLRFDGYFVAADALELPNLAQRSSRYWQVGAKRTLLGLSAMRLPGLARGERGWLLAYAPLSFVYRGVLLLSLAVVLADLSAWLGLIVLALATWTCALKPLLDMATYLWSSPELSLQRARAASVGLGALAMVGLLAFMVPLPHRTHAPAVVWLPNDAIVRLGSDGFVEQVLVADGQQVQAGTVLIKLANDPLRVDLERVLVDLQRRDVERAALFADAALRRGVLDDEIARLSAERQRLQQRVDQLVVRAAVDGRVAIDARLQVIGRYLPQGQVVAHVLPAGAPLVRVLVRNDAIAAVSRRPGPIRVALADADSGELPAQLERATPRASVSLPTAALSEAGGGTIALRAGDNGQSLTAREPFFELDLRLPATAVAHIGARALVTFDHGQASAAELVGLFVRRAFLRHFER